MDIDDKVISEQFRILVVDDQPITRQMIRDVVSYLGYGCLEAADGIEALEILEKEAVDLVLTDIFMPRLDGIALTQAIKGKYDSNVIVMTGIVGDFTYEEVIAKGASDFILKPIRIQELLVRIKRILGERIIIAERNRMESTLRESEKQYRTLFESIADTVFLIDQETGSLLDVNPAATRMYGFNREEFLRMTTTDVSDEPEKTARATSEPVPFIPLRYHRHKDGSVFPVELTASLFELRGRNTIIATARDISDRKQAEGKLAAESHQLEETNTALRVLLQRRQEDQKEMERKILANIKTLVLPHLEKLRSLKLNNVQANCLDIVDANLQQVISPFLQNLAAIFADFTPREIQVANMIREGKTGKEIAHFFGSSLRTVEFHRDNIRKKLGLNHKKSNLRTFLMKLSEK